MKKTELVDLLKYIHELCNGEPTRASGKYKSIYMLNGNRQHVIYSPEFFELCDIHENETLMIEVDEMKSWYDTITSKDIISRNGEYVYINTKDGYKLIGSITDNDTFDDPQKYLSEMYEHNITSDEMDDLIRHEVIIIPLDDGNSIFRLYGKLIPRLRKNDKISVYSSLYKDFKEVDWKIYKIIVKQITSFGFVLHKFLIVSPYQPEK